MEDPCTKTVEHASVTGEGGDLRFECFRPAPASKMTHDEHPVPMCLIYPVCAVSHKEGTPHVERTFQDVACVVLWGAQDNWSHNAYPLLALPAL